jgi:hypothetical protein
VNTEGFNFASYADYISDDFLLNAREAKTLEEKKNQFAVNIGVSFDIDN